MKCYSGDPFEFFIILVIFIAGLGYAVDTGITQGQLEGRIIENQRIMECYNSKSFSGFVWIDNSPYFICEHDMEKGKVVYSKIKDE